MIKYGMLNRIIIEMSYKFTYNSHVEEERGEV